MPKIVDDIRYAASILEANDPGGTLSKTMLAHSNTVYDLLEACKALCDAIDADNDDFYIVFENMEKAYQQTRKAIAKAEPHDNNG